MSRARAFFAPSLILVATTAAGCGDRPSGSPRFVPATVGSASNASDHPTDAERDARPARNIATH